MLWITKVHYGGVSGSYQINAYETDFNESPETIAKKAIEGYGVGDIKHIEIVVIQEKDLRNWISFDVKTVLENRG